MITHPTNDLLQKAQQFVLDNPRRLLGKLDWNGQTVWLKRRPAQKKTYWHGLQGMLARLLAVPIFSTTATRGGAQSLQDEAALLQLFYDHGLNVPRVLAVTDDFLLTEDAGIQLQHYLRTLACPKIIQQFLHQAVLIVRRMHQLGLCHGRPALKDMTLLQNTISLIDLEENPLNQMSLAQAQARDIWLFLNSAAQFCRQDPEILTELFIAYQEDIHEDILQELKRMVCYLKPLRWLLDHRFLSSLGRDVYCAVSANRVLERYFSSSPY